MKLKSIIGSISLVLLTVGAALLIDPAPKATRVDAADAADALPSAYCMRDEYIVYAQHQDAHGYCWNFAGTTAAATTIMKATGEYYDFSADSHRFCHEVPHLKPGDKGKIELPLSPDYDERPRQKVDITQGKAALTEYEVLTVNGDGTTDILFHPHTGRTHQLRVHSAHILGLGRPILGDLLYGGCGSIWAEDREYARLHLHACSITFRHPSTGESLTLTW